MKQSCKPFQKINVTIINVTSYGVEINMKSPRKPKALNFYMREDEKVILEKYAEQVNKSQAEVLRECVRNLASHILK